MVKNFSISAASKRFPRSNPPLFLHKRTHKNLLQLDHTRPPISEKKKRCAPFPRHNNNNKIRARERRATSFFNFLHRGRRRRCCIHLLSYVGWSENGISMKLLSHYTCSRLRRNSFLVRHALPTPTFGFDLFFKKRSGTISVDI